jgi:hypothetical protein
MNKESRNQSGNEKPLPGARLIYLLVSSLVTLLVILLVG